MQIEQVVAGVDGDPQAQAIQLRMRSPSQNFVSVARVYAHDAAGENPILLLDISADVASSALGSRVLLATAQLASYTTPAVQPDFVLENPIPEDYLQAGSITFENDDGTLIVWRLSWGGDGYSGETQGALTNDDDRDFGPPWPTGLPVDTLQGLLFDGAAADKSSTNLADYVLTAGAAVLANNAGNTFTVTELQCPDGPTGDADGDHTCDDADNCVGTPNEGQEDADEDGFGDACDACPNDPQKLAVGLCGCGNDDDDDDDADGVIDCVDNCPGLSNADQADADDDGVGDDCDNGNDNTSGNDNDNANVNDNGSTGNDNGIPDNANDNAADNDNQAGDTDDGASGGAQPRGCGVAMLPVLLMSLLLLADRRRRFLTVP